ncbi:MAG: crossover junction endodeoxyribonuclease RuvC [Alphaproteobacteria bacterium]|nr:crossover junction endodeoxyribonuclease RuvC [Alphaproteobacteria bacterium]
MTRIIGIDPGLQKTGWGIIEKEGNALRFLQCGQIRTNAKTPLSQRLALIDEQIRLVLRLWNPQAAAIEETFMNNNPASALLLGQARGAAIVSLAREGLSVAEYPANLVKKSLVGNGHATKDQIGMMVSMLLPGAKAASSDEADALAIAICHAHHAATFERIAG